MTISSTKYNQVTPTSSGSKQAIAQLLEKLQARGIQIWQEEEKLRFRLPKNQQSYKDELRTELRQHKSAILEFLQEQASDTQQAPLLQSVSRDQHLPLSFAQQRLWFLAQFDPASTPYNESGGLKLIGLLNIAALEKSLTELTRRHEILRTAFPQDDGMPYQRIKPVEAIQLPLHDLRDFDTTEQQQRLQQIALEQDAKVFNLATGPLLRLNLLRLSDVAENQPCYVLLSTMHHIIADMWSMDIFTRELSRLYQAFSQNQTAELPALPVQYADFAYWQRQWLSGDRLEKQLVYWKQTLQGAPALLELPIDYPRPAIQTFQGARQAIKLSAKRFCNTFSQ